MLQSSKETLYKVCLIFIILLRRSVCAERTLDIDDGECLVNVVACDEAAGRHDDASAALVLLHVELDHALLSRHRLQLLVVYCPQMLDVDRPTLRAHCMHRLQGPVLNASILDLMELPMDAGYKVQCVVLALQ